MKTTKPSITRDFNSNSGGAMNAADASDRTAPSELATLPSAEEAQASAGLLPHPLYLEVARGAFFDPRKVVDATGRPLALDELDADTASAVAELDVQTTMRRSKDGTVTTVHKYRFVNRAQYVDMGMKLLGGYGIERSPLGGVASDGLAELLRGLRHGPTPAAEHGAGEDDEAD